MRALSSKTELFDPYRAGFALGENLAALAPEVVFLYSSMHYATPELLEGLYDGLDSDKAIIIGNTASTSNIANARYFFCIDKQSTTGSLRSKTNDAISD